MEGTDIQIVCPVVVLIREGCLQTPARTDEIVSHAKEAGFEQVVAFHRYFALYPSMDGFRDKIMGAVNRVDEHNPVPPYCAGSGAMRKVECDNLHMYLGEKKSAAQAAAAAAAGGSSSGGDSVKRRRKEKTIPWVAT